MLLFYFTVIQALPYTVDVLFNAVVFYNTFHHFVVINIFNITMRFRSILFHSICLFKGYKFQTIKNKIIIWIVYQGKLNSIVMLKLRIVMLKLRIVMLKLN